MLRFQPLIAAWVVAAALVASGAFFIKRVWLDRSVVPPPAGLYAGGLWGGRTAQEAKPPRIFLDNDPYYWINYARRMVAEHSWRIRHTDIDNAPYGRDVHWSSSYAWWMIITGFADHLWTGKSMYNAIESASVWSDPLLFLIFLACFGVVVAMERTVRIAGLAIIALASLGPVVWDFGYGRPDHHGIHAIAAIGLITCLVFGRGGWIVAGRLGERSAALRTKSWFRAAGVFAGVGLWVGASEQIIIICLVAVGAASGMLLQKFVASPNSIESRPPQYDPTMWRAWGTSAAVTAAVFYAIEYLPNHVSMRLEVNHPVYILAIWGGGELMAFLGSWLVLGKKFHGRDLIRLGIGTSLLLVVPALLLLGPPEWYALRDGYMRRLHAHIIEFQPFFELAGPGVIHRVIRFAQAFGGFPILFLLATWLIARRRIKREETIGVCLAAIPAASLLGISLIQARWAGLCGVASVVLALALEPALRRRIRSLQHPGLWASLAITVLLAPSLVSYLLITWDRTRLMKSPNPSQDLARAIATRDVALNLRRYLALGPVRVMAAATETPALYHFGHVAGIASLYWENVQGAHDMADFFADQTDEVARRIAKKRGITHVLVGSDSGVADDAYYLKYGKVDPDEVKKTLGYRLADPTGKIPKWLEPMPYYASPMAAAFHLRLFRVVKEAL
jgi:hypothetical protein